jgi:hypothetical protein
MDEQALVIKLASADSGCQKSLNQIKVEASGGFSVRYNHSEELFLRLNQPLRIPSFPIFHPVGKPIPSPAYTSAIREVVRQLAQTLPEVFFELSYFFDSSDVFKPSFYRLYKIGEELFLYLVRVDLSNRPTTVRVITPGTNDLTPEYETTDLYLSSECVPLSGLRANPEGGVEAFVVRQAISDTWIGETGKGYTVKGIWMDADLSKFFTKLFLSPGRSLYPYYPVFCRYKTVCGCLLAFDPERRRGEIQSFYRHYHFLEPYIETIQQALKQHDFSESLEEFREIQGAVPVELRSAYDGAKVSASLNERDMKEYVIEL